ncbi:ArdC family protein [Glaciimonas sp. Gout2]|uniref:ArdC family protein n=1 Tax=Glaciimonas sp. Gout2 TaxID=3048625 RepID=UPI002B238E7A|nr:zincin-like metallopeptidase domain-containing protein [Glaciimonas sp. Gout2]
MQGNNRRNIMDIRQVITDKIIFMLENGTTKSNSRWTIGGQGALPKNASTDVAYNGINVLLLWAAAAESSYTSSRWMTYKQAAGVGAQVRKGEKSTMCAYFEMMRSKTDEIPASGEDSRKGFFPMCKPFFLFNIAQMDNVPEALLPQAAPVKNFSINETAEQLIISTGATINHGFDSAFYTRSKDAISLPNREQFRSPEAYYATALHELTHWTGHESRLNREHGKRFGDNAYAFEELVAEIGAAFISGHMGFVDVMMEDHASYVESWLTVLKNDKTAIFTASKQASNAYEFILAKAAREQPEHAEI